ncbi:hypothetical protein BLNAU_7817 [Blattamonas nauphoetae]|uniref:Uncharacterized protein n=1 Tax=Blattamonas nauphoetae TaxID=2049346 RepID=A0ABQ9Y0F7_9EUKA|nr:hypothetical protein BLNAU_7817 [Blattamonas nauphoetae]
MVTISDPTRHIGYGFLTIHRDDLKPERICQDTVANVDFSILPDNWFRIGHFCCSVSCTQIACLKLV